MTDFLEFVSPLRGARFRPQAAKDVVTALEAGTVVTLEADPDNPADPNAIMVIHNDQHIGFIAKDIAAAMIDDFNAADAYDCVVDYFLAPRTPVLSITLISDEAGDEAA